MKKQIVYQIVKNDKLSKTVHYDNELLTKTLTFPHVGGYVKSERQLKTFLHFKNTFQSQNIQALVLPISNWDILERAKRDPKNKETLERLQIIFDTMPEYWYYSSLQEKNYEKLARSEATLSPNAKKYLLNPIDENDKLDKNEIYNSRLEEIFSEENALTNLTVNQINQQSKKGADVLTPYYPVIVDASSLAYVKQIYEFTKRYYLTDLRNITQETGKHIALSLTIDATIFSNSRLQEGLAEKIKKVVEEEKPEFIILKFLNIDIKGAANEDVGRIMEFLEWIGNYSFIHKIQVHLMKCNVLGNFAIKRGIDSFSQPIDGKEADIAFKMRKQTFATILENNPLFQLGKIYDYKQKQFIEPQKYFNGIIQTKTVKCHGDYCNTLTVGEIVQMQVNRNLFWTHKQLHLLETKNLEVDEIITSINDGLVDKHFLQKYPKAFNLEAL